MKKCVCNVVAGKPEDHRISRDNHRKYAKSIGAKYEVVELPPITDWSYCWWKYEAAKVAAKFDVTLYLDSDTLVTKNCPDFSKAVPRGHWGLVDEYWPLRKHGRDFMHEVAGRIPAKVAWQANGGVLIMPPDAQRVYHREDWLQPSWIIDQMLLSWRLQKGEAEYRLLDRRWNWSYMNFNDFRANIEHAFIIHYAGQTHFEEKSAKPKLMEKHLETFGC